MKKLLKTNNLSRHLLGQVVVVEVFHCAPNPFFKDRVAEFVVDLSFIRTKMMLSPAFDSYQQTKRGQTDRCKKESTVIKDFDHGKVLFNNLTKNGVAVRSPLNGITTVSTPKLKRRVTLLREKSGEMTTHITCTHKSLEWRREFRPIHRHNSTNSSIFVDSHKTGIVELLTSTHFSFFLV